MSEDCPNCKAMRDERDEALRLVAIEREKANAILLSQSAAVPAPPPPKPLRYWIVDVLNDGMKKALPWPQAGVRAAVRFLRRDKP